MNKIKIKTSKVEIKEIDKEYPIYLKKDNQLVRIENEQFHCIMYHNEVSVHIVFNKYEYNLKESDLLNETSKEDFEKTLNLLMNKFDFDNDLDEQV